MKEERAMRATRAMRAKDPTHTLRTELAAARRELWATQLKLARCKRELRSARNLLATVAHDINNPLAYIQSNLCSLSRYADKIASYAEAVMTAEPLLGRAHDDERHRGGCLGLRVGGRGRRGHGLCGRFGGGRRR